MTKRHFFNGYVTSLYFEFWVFSIYLWNYFISSQYKIICEIYCLFHNGNIYGYTLYILLIVFNHFVKIRLFFTTFQKFRNKSRKNTILKNFKNLFLPFFSVFMLKFLFRNIFNLFRKEIKVLTPFGGGCIVLVSKDKGVTNTLNYCSLKSI